VAICSFEHYLPLKCSFETKAMRN